MILPWIEATGCCDIVMSDLADSVCNWEQAGVLRTATSPEEANLLVVSGWINKAQVENLRDIYSKMSTPKVVVAAGSCSLSGSVFDNLKDTVVLDEILPVNFRVTGCPPRWDDILKGISAAMNSGQKERTVKEILNDTSKDVVF